MFIFFWGAELLLHPIYQMFQTKGQLLSFTVFKMIVTISTNIFQIPSSSQKCWLQWDTKGLMTSRTEVLKLNGKINGLKPALKYIYIYITRTNEGKRYFIKSIELLYTGPQSFIQNHWDQTCFRYRIFQNLGKKFYNSVTAKLNEMKLPPSVGRGKGTLAEENPGMLLISKPGSW